MSGCLAPIPKKNAGIKAGHSPSDAHGAFPLAVVVNPVFQPEPEDPRNLL